MESELEGIGKTLLDTKLVFDQGMTKLLEFGNNVVKAGFDEVIAGGKTSNETQKKIDEAMQETNGFLRFVRWWIETGAAQPPTEWHAPAPPPGWFGTPPPGGLTTPQKPQ